MRLKLLFLSILGTAFILTNGCFERRYGTMTASEMFPDPKVRALAEAGASGDIKAIDRAIAAGADVNATGKDGVTPLFWAIASTYNFEGFEYLLKKGADPNISPTTDNHSTVMDLAAWGKDIRFLYAAIRAGGDVNLVSPYFRYNGTPIFFATMGRNIKSVALLLANGAQIDFQNSNGRTPLMTNDGDYYTVYYLLKMGADPFLTTKTGHTIWADVLVSQKRMDPDSESYYWLGKVIELLKQKGSQPNQQDLKLAEGTRPR